MPKLTMIDFSNPAATASLNGFQFSAARPEELTESEYTLATILVDDTGSVSAFGRELVAMMQAAKGACDASPRADNLLLRVVRFHSRPHEIHGFKPLSAIDAAAEYGPLQLGQGGTTALFDAALEVLGATAAYGETLAGAHDLDVNAIVFFITDGGDNASKATPRKIAKFLRETRAREKLQSMTTILIGINDDSCRHELQRFHKEAELTAYISAGSATPSKLARLGQFLSRSIQSTSTSLSSGGKSPTIPSLTF